MSTVTTSLTLLDALRSGRDQRAWQEFVRRYAVLLLAFSKRLGLTDADAADAVQDTLVAVYRDFRREVPSFDHSKGRFKSWLCKIAQNNVRAILRRRYRTVLPESQLSTPDSSWLDNLPEPRANELFDTEWQREQLASALRQVARESDPVVFQAFELYALHGHRPEKVARLLGVTRNAVYISKYRIVQRLRVVLARLQEEEG